MTHDRTAAVPPAVDLDNWERFDGFRETFLVDFTVPGHNDALRRLSDVLSALIGEAYPVMPKIPEGSFRASIRAALADLRFLHGFLTDMTDHFVISPADEALARLVRRKALALGKIADAIEGALTVPSEP